MCTDTTGRSVNAMLQASKIPAVKGGCSLVVWGLAWRPTKCSRLLVIAGLPRYWKISTRVWERIERIEISTRARCERNLVILLLSHEQDCVEKQNLTQR
jgi:hypothetical protein